MKYSDVEAMLNHDNIPLEPVYGLMTQRQFEEKIDTLHWYIIPPTKGMVAHDPNIKSTRHIAYGMESHNLDIFKQKRGIALSYIANTVIYVDNNGDYTLKKCRCVNTDVINNSEWFNKFRYKLITLLIL
jgi:hypothetical protein